MTAAPPRRWFRFSLRTLFVVVTVVCCLLGWLALQVKTVHDRRETQTKLESAGGVMFLGGPALGHVKIIRYGNLNLEPSLIRIKLGDSIVNGIYFDHFTTPDEIQRIECFPEAAVYAPEAFEGGRRPYRHK